MHLLRVVKLLIAYVLMTGLVFSTISLAEAGPHRHRGDHGGFPGGFLEEHATRLGLNEETLDAIRKIIDESQDASRDLFQKLREARLAMRDLLSQDMPDDTAVMRQAEVLGQIETETRKLRLGTMLRIRALLTPEQRQELMRIRKELKQWKRHGGPDPGAEQ
jgi:Spy/CpxP family protein refolding chaperone